MPVSICCLLSQTLHQHVYNLAIDLILTDHTLQINIIHVHNTHTNMHIYTDNHIHKNTSNHTYTCIHTHNKYIPTHAHTSAQKTC